MLTSPLLYGIALKNQLESPTPKYVRSPPGIPEWKVMAEVEKSVIDDDVIEITSSRF